ncbi:MAG: hypothetical protein AB7C90_09645, partial [Bacteroidales bacterium]
MAGIFTFCNWIFSTRFCRVGLVAFLLPAMLSLFSAPSFSGSEPSFGGAAPSLFGGCPVWAENPPRSTPKGHSVHSSSLAARLYHYIDQSNKQPETG